MFVTSKRYRELMAELERIREREDIIAGTNGILRDTIALLEAENRLHRENMAKLRVAIGRMLGKEPE